MRGGDRAVPWAPRVAVGVEAAAVGPCRSEGSGSIRARRHRFPTSRSWASPGAVPHRSSTSARHRRAQRRDRGSPPRALFADQNGGDGPRSEDRRGARLPSQSLDYSFDVGDRAGIPAEVDDGLGDVQVALTAGDRRSGQPARALVVRAHAVSGRHRNLEVLEGVNHREQSAVVRRSREHRAGVDLAGARRPSRGSDTRRRRAQRAR